MKSTFRRSPRRVALLLVTLIIYVAAYTTLLDDVLADITFLPRIETSETDTEVRSASPVTNSGLQPSTTNRPTTIVAIQVDTTSVIEATASLASSVVSAVENSVSVPVLPSPLPSASSDPHTASLAAVDRAARAFATLPLQPGATIVALGADSGSWAAGLGALFTRSHSPDAATAAKVIILPSSPRGHERACTALGIFAGIVTKEASTWDGVRSSLPPVTRVQASSLFAHSLLLDSFIHLSPVEDADSPSVDSTVHLSAHLSSPTAIAEVTAGADAVWIAAHELSSEELTAAIAAVETSAAMVVATRQLPGLALNRPATLAANALGESDQKGEASEADAEDLWTVWVYGGAERTDSLSESGNGEASTPTLLSASKPVPSSKTACFLQLQLPSLAAAAREDALLSGWVDAVSPVVASFTPSQPSYAANAPSRSYTPGSSSRSHMSQKSDRDDVEDEGADDALDSLDGPSRSASSAFMPSTIHVVVAVATFTLLILGIFIVYQTIVRQQSFSVAVGLFTPQDVLREKESSVRGGHHGGTMLYQDDSELEMDSNEHRWP